MFETVAVAPPADPGRRLASASLTLLLSAAALAGVWSLGARVVALPPPDPAPLEVTLYEALPAAPAAVAPERAPPRPRARSATPQVAAPQVPTPTLNAPVDPSLTALTPGTGGGPEQTTGAEGEGEGEGEGGGDVRAVHWSEVKAKRRVEPRFPETARQLGVSEGRCTLRFVIDARGEPTDIRADPCPEVFKASALEAAWQWRFYPMRIEGRAVPATFALVVNYQLR